MYVNLSSRATRRKTNAKTKDQISSVRTKVPTDLRRSKLRGGSDTTAFSCFFSCFSCFSCFFSSAVGAGVATAAGLAGAPGRRPGRAPPPQAPPPGWKSSRPCTPHPAERACGVGCRKAGFRLVALEHANAEGCACALALERALGRDRTRRVSGKNMNRRGDICGIGAAGRGVRSESGRPGRRAPGGIPRSGRCPRDPRVRSICARRR